MGHTHLAFSLIKKFFNSALAKKLLPNEYVLCDKGYTETHCVNNINGDTQLSSKLIARHEKFNKRLKIFNILRDKF